MENLENHPDYRQARRHVRAVRGFYTHGLWVFAFRGWLGPDWETRRIRECLDRGARR